MKWPILLVMVVLCSLSVFGLDNNLSAKVTLGDAYIPVWNAGFYEPWEDMAFANDGDFTTWAERNGTGNVGGSSSYIMCLNATNVYSTSNVTLNIRIGGTDYLICANDTSSSDPVWVPITSAHFSEGAFDEYMKRNLAFPAGFYNQSLPVECYNETLGGVVEVCMQRQFGTTAWYEATLDFVTDIAIDNCSELTNKSLQFNIYNSTNSSIISPYLGITDFAMTINFSVAGIGGSSYSNDVTNQTICKAPISQDVSADIEVEYSVSDSATFTYKTKDLTLTNETNIISLYLTTGTTPVTFTVKDTTGASLEGASIQILEWDVGEGLFKLTQQLESDFNGEAIGNVVLNTVKYKFIIKYLGEVKLDTTPSEVKSTTVNFILDLASDYYDEAISPEGIYAALTFDNATKTFTYTWANAPTVIDNICLNVERQTLNSLDELGSTCTARTESGSIAIVIGETLETNTYKAHGYLLEGNNRLASETLTESFDYGWKVFGQQGVLITLFISITLVMVGIWNIAVAIFLFLIAVIVTNILGLFKLDMPWLITLIVLGIITIVRISKR